MSRRGQPFGEAEGRGLGGALADLDGRQVDEVQVMARNALNGLFVLVRLSMMHSLNNEAFDRPLKEMEALVGRYLAAGEVFSLKLLGDNFFAGNVMIRLDSTSFTSSQYLVRCFERLGIGAVGASAQVGREDLVGFLAEVSRAMAAKDDDERKGMLADRRFGALIVRGPLGKADPLIELKRESQRLYALLAIARHEFVERGERDHFPPMRRMKRLVQRTVDIVDAGPQIGAALAAHNGGSEHWLYRPVNVAILSILLGREVGLDRNAQALLGMAAVLHDLGERETAGGAAGDGERRRSPEAVSLLMRVKGLNEETLLWTVVADEVGLYTGRSAKRARWYHGEEGPGLESRIVAVAHLYERMINSTPSSAASPHTAVLYLLKRAGKELDAPLVRSFVRAFGLYPVGTVLELADGTRWIVVDNHGDPRRLASPVVKELGRRAGPEVQARIVDLAETPARIARVVPPAEISVNVPAEALA